VSWPTKVQRRHPRYSRNERTFSWPGIAVSFLSSRDQCGTGSRQAAAGWRTKGPVG
jgi:hypothetical protein